MTNPTNPDALLTTAEVARIARISPATLAGWRVQKRGPAFTKVGGLVRYRRSDLQSWLDRQRVPTR